MLNRKNLFKTLICKALLILSFVDLYGQNNNHEKLWYKAPASATATDSKDGWNNDPEWLKALPIGNGFLGAMVFGDVNHERFQLNDKSLWSGSPDDNDNPEARKSLDKIRQLLFEGKYKEATELTDKTQICKGAGSGHGNGSTAPFGCFQTLGDLRLDFHRDDSFSDYYRELDLITGIASSRYKQKGVSYSREVFASNPDRAIVIRLTADRPSSISFGMSMDRPERFTTTIEANTLVMRGVMSNGKGGDGMKYRVNVIPLISGGKISTNGNTLEIEKANAVTIIITAATNYRLQYPDYLNNNFEAELSAITQKARAVSYPVLKSRHIKDFSKFMERSALKIQGEVEMSLPTDELLQKNAKTKFQPELYNTYYQYGRYLLLSSSREGSLPANLQGIWCNKLQSPWNGDYHTDVNVQMNYWPAEVTNLSETHLQLTDLIESLVKPGSRTAQIQYQMKGWCLHPITNVWGYTAPGEEPSWGLHVGGGGWICQHLWQHYIFTKDLNYLKRVYPILKQAALFYTDWLVKDPRTGKYVSGPASSPENTFITSDGTSAQISMGPSHDQEVIHELFTNTLNAAKLLHAPDKEFQRELTEMLANLARPQIASDGRLMEWAQEFKEAEPTHRHVSHLYALHPGNDITLDKTPDMAEAVKKSLLTRGDSGTGWSLASKINLWARLQDGDHAFRLLNNLLRPVLSSGVNMSNGGGTYYNLFCAHPPFQIDGNFGGTAGIAELLLQSQEEFINLLPALPSSWKNGSVQGLVARGNFVIDLSWKNGTLTTARLTSRTGGKCQIKYGTKMIQLATVAGARYDLMTRL